MSEGISGRQLAKALKVSETAVRKAVKAGRIKPDAEGKFDPVACAAAWEKSTDPGRSKVREPANQMREPANQGAQPAVRTADEAQAAVALIARVLRDEGVEDDGVAVDFAKARTADTILKAYERDLKIAVRRRELVPAASVKEHVAKAFIGLRQSVQRIPSRHAAAIAAELGCDPAALDAALSKVIAAELDGLSTPVVRT